MSFNPKRSSRKLNTSSKSKIKQAETESYTVYDLPSLKRKRTIALNRMLKALEIGRLAKADDVHCDLFFSYCDQAKKFVAEFEEAHFFILELLESCDGSGDDDEIRARFDDAYFQVMSILRNLRKSELNLSDTSNMSAGTNIKSPLSHVRLPKIQLPSFSGNIKKWPEFIDTFNALIHNCPSLTDVEKFHYLISSLSGDPLSLIRVFPVTGDYYSDAYAALIARYQNNRELAYTCWKDILNVNLKIHNINEFRRSLDSIDENLSILRKLNLPVEQWEFIIVYHILSKLESKLRRDFEESCCSSEFPTYINLKEFLHSKCEALIRDNHFSEASKATSHVVKDSIKSSSNIVKRRSVTHTLVASHSDDKPITGETRHDTPKVMPKCAFCTDAAHSISHCKQFLSKSVDERMSVANEKRWCFNCLKSSHQLKDCKSIFRCLKCKHKHHTLLHKQQSTDTPSRSVSLIAKTSGYELCTKSSLNTTVLLATAIVQVLDENGRYHSFRALFDTGSQNNLITCDAARILNIKQVPCDTNINGLGGMSADISHMVRCSLASNNKVLFDVDMHVISTICGDQPIAKLNTNGWSHIQSLSLADPGFDIPGPIDILLGADIFADSLLDQCMKGRSNQPVAMNSVFGWLLLGRTHLTSSSLLQYTAKSDELSSMVQRFWEIDNVPQASILTPLDMACEKAYITDHYRDSTGRYGVQLPFKDGVEPKFENSRSIALRRFKAIENRLSRDPTLYMQYSEFMDDYERSGHMTLVPVKELGEGKYYIPHHCIVKPDSSTTKLRVVFDASARDTSGKSLNDTLLTGPKLQSDIVQVLLLFRLHVVVFLADIRQMYRQILIADNHRDYQRILWRSNPGQVLQEYRLNTVTYGVSSAPFLACRTIKQLAEDEGSAFPLAKQILNSDIYVDDIVTGCETLDEALEAKSQIIRLFELGHFQLRKWASNVPGLLSDIPQEECLLNSKTFTGHESCSLKVLGLKWEPTTDTFSFDVKSSSRPCTKRVILSEIAKIFDPLGFLAPLTIKAKCLLQRLWLLGIDWDSDTPEDVNNVWETFCNQLSILKGLRIPRRMTIDNTLTYELHGFCDSSELAYGAVIYLRVTDVDGFTQIRLVCAKARVAPIKKISLPRLELCAAVLLTNLAKFVLDTYLSKVTLHSIYLWSDSTVVLSWLRSHSSRWTTFVANRVGHIQDIFCTELWHHVASSDNPADICSRGNLPYDLFHNALWWSGPSWLVKPSDQWPTNQQVSQSYSSEDESIVRAEERRTVVLATRSEDDYGTVVLDLLKRYSSLEKITHIVSYIRRFIHNVKNPHDRHRGSILTEMENHNSLLFIVKIVQSSSFAGEIQRLQAKQPLPKPLRKLNLFLDEDGILRVGGRISRAGLEFEHRHPALLPNDHEFTFRVIESIHRQHCHTGHNTTHYLILQRFWILSAKRVIRRCLSKCIRCFKTKPKSLEPYMSDLPSFRVNQVKPFSIVGVDFGGPFRIKLGTHRGAKIDKAYLCLFVCLATKAVHLEVVSSLSADGFLAALRRFVGRRGRCNVIHADCGTNFIGVSNYLSLLKNALHTERIEFKFNPPSAPHFGGVWEIQIKAAKSHLYRIIGNQVLTFEELSTLFVQIEAVLNSRPLYALSTDPNDLNVLTPGHFLTLEPLTTVPDADYSNIKLHRLTRWQLIQSFIQNFWTRWKNEYLHSLTLRAKWTKGSKPLDVNAVVLIKDDNRAPLHWSLGRVEELHPGPDGIVRIATVKTKDSLIKRPLVKLCPLPIES